MARFMYHEVEDIIVWLLNELGPYDAGEELEETLGKNLSTINIELKINNIEIPIDSLYSGILSELDRIVEDKAKELIDEYADRLEYDITLQVKKFIHCLTFKNDRSVDSTDYNTIHSILKDD